MVAPTAEQIRTWSKVEWADFGYEVTVPDPLDVLIPRAQVYIEDVTGRLLVDLETRMEPLMEQAMQMRVEQLAIQSESGYAETASDEVVTQFTAGSYSESRADPIKRGQAIVLNEWPGLSKLLWLMMTDEKRDAWLYDTTGKVAPGFAVTEVDWAGELPTTRGGGAWPDVPRWANY